MDVVTLPTVFSLSGEINHFYRNSFFLTLIIFFQKQVKKWTIEISKVDENSDTADFCRFLAQSLSIVSSYRLFCCDFDEGFLSLLQGTAPSILVWILYSIVIAVIFLAIKCLNYRLHLMFDGEEIRTESEQQEEVRSGESGGDRDENSRAEVRSSTVEHGGEVIELEVINRCSEEVANEPGAENVAQSTSCPSGLPPQLPPSSTSLLLNASSVATATKPHQVQLICLLTIIFTRSFHNNSWKPFHFFVHTATSNFLCGVCEIFFTW